MRNDVRQRGLAQAGRADENFKLLARLGLADVVANSLGRSARSIASSRGDSGAADMTRREGGRSANWKSSVWMVILVYRLLRYEA